jgi:hypothetical protein
MAARSGTRRCEVCAMVTEHALVCEVRGFEIPRCARCGLGSTVPPDAFNPLAIYNEGYFQGAAQDGYCGDDVLDFTGNPLACRRMDAVLSIDHQPFAEQLQEDAPVAERGGAGQALASPPPAGAGSMTAWRAVPGREASPTSRPLLTVSDLGNAKLRMDEQMTPGRSGARRRGDPECP